MKTELDQQMANLAGTSLLQFLFFLLQLLQTNVSSKSACSHLQQQAAAAIPALKQALASQDSGGPTIDDCSLAELVVQHKHQVKALIGRFRPFAQPVLTRHDVYWLS